MECKHKRICEVMAGLGDVEILEASEPLDGALLVEVYQIQDPGLADEYTRRLAADLQDQSCPPEVNQLGRAIARWYDQIVAWHRSRVSNGPTEAVNNLIKRIKRIGFGFRNFTNYRIRALLYAGKPNWDLLPSVTPP